jgi:ribonucleoside-triphosphate reductase
MQLAQSTIREIQAMTPEFGYNGFGEFVFYRTYSRSKPDGSMETWNDVILRVTQGTFEIRKSWYLRNGIPWDEDFWQTYARNFAISMFKMHWLPPGRGLWVMGTPFVKERGSMALNNCGFAVIKNIAKDTYWVMDALMNGVGVGFYPKRDDSINLVPFTESYEHVIADSREGWCDSVSALIESYFGGPRPNFDYSKIREHGEPIRGFGGVASGPNPLKELHSRIDQYFMEFDGDSVRLKADIVNAIGCCVVAGNVRRSAELMAGHLDDSTFMELKNYDKHPERAAIGYMSNNSVYLEDDSDFEQLAEIANRVIKNGEPGYINLRNLPKGRLGKDDGLKEDRAIGFNPCGEQPLEDKELCCLAETLPTKCPTVNDWYKACEYATVYASTVTLLPTHSEESNAVMLRNRRIGISLVDVTGWLEESGANKVIKHLRQGYKIVRKANQWVNSEAGVPEAIRVTTVKPGGTVPKVAGKTAGIGYPTFIHTLVRVLVSASSPVAQILKDANLPYEPQLSDPEGTLVFEWPIIQGPAKPATQASLWEQAMNLVMVQREWSDNAVSNTLYFKPKWVLKKTNFDGQPELNQKVATDQWGQTNLYEYDPNHEEYDIERVLSMIAPLTKSVSLLPHTPGGVYPQSHNLNYQLKNTLKDSKTYDP